MQPTAAGSDLKVKGQTHAAYVNPLSTSITFAS